MRSRAITKRLICQYEPKSPIAEAYRILRTNIQYSSVMKQIKTLTVASAGPEEGKTTTIANLAVVFAETGKRVIIIDADLRKPTVHRIFDLSNQQGLTNILAGRQSYQQVVQAVPSSGVHVITAGPIPPNPAEFIGSFAMQALIEQVKTSYDLVLIDSPPVLPVTDGQLLAGYSDGTLLVARSGKVTKDQIRKAKQLLEMVGGHIIGVVLNGKKMSKESYCDYYAAADQS